jgi:hypothetical protein
VAVETLSYAINNQDHLVKVDAGYYRFAEENGWDASNSLGRSLWDFVSGDEMRKLQRLLLRRLRDEVRQVELPFRCDGAAVRREMAIRIAAHPSGNTVLFSARVRAEEWRDEIQPLLDPEVPRRVETITMCGWCDRFEVEGEWVEVEVAVAKLELFDLEALPTIDHGVCPHCNETLLAA